MPPKKRVFFRMFPTEKIEFDDMKIDVESKKIYVRRLQDLSSNCTKTEPNFWEFKTDGIFFNSKQETVYEDVTEGVLKSVIDGENAVILAFGQTGSGKTFTTSGLHLTEQEFGFLPRIAKDLFALKKKEPKNIKMSFQMSYVEFYNTHAIDLLSKPPKHLVTHKCREARQILISNEFDALTCIFTGEGRKNFVENNRSYLSNVCTSVVTFHIVKKNMDLTNPVKLYSRLHIVDMAGNESCLQTNRLYKTTKEIGLANVTKSQLEQFILCLMENIPPHIRVKQRTNTLTYYLDGDLSQESILRFVGHIKARTKNLIITLSMLRFSNIVQGLKMKKRAIQFDVNEEIELTYLKNKLKAIEQEKYLNSVLLNQDLVTGMNPARLAHLDKLVHDYLANSIGEITVLNVADTNVVLRNIKTICQNYQGDINRLQTENELLQARRESEASLKQKSSKTSSQSWGSKSSRKSLKLRSKESSLREKKTSGSIVSEKRIKTSGSEENVASELTSLHQKRRKTTKPSTSALAKSSQSKKRSSNTSVVRDSKSSMDVNIPIPDVVPEKQEMWKRFTANTSYRDQLEEYRQNEKDIRSSFMSYIKEIKNLKNRRDSLDKLGQDLITAQTFRKFNSKDEFDDQGNLVISFAEKDCKERIQEARELLLRQQETALTAQEMLKIYVKNRNAIVKKTECEFEQFCNENYKMPSVEIDVVQTDWQLYTFDASLDYPDAYVEPIEEITLLPEVSREERILPGLQNLMLREQQKRKQLMIKKKREWRNF